ncbi:MAG TPA: hypothetical protein VFI42_07575 [Thermomicrobiaceae bacterium]|nr:hypothetical protein [Thermomicrobiaceae bacterium]
MGLLDQLLGNDQPQQKQDYQDFIKRYEQGTPGEGYSGQEVLNRYQQVAPELNQQQYLSAAESAFERMSPQERADFAQYLQQQAQQNNVNVPRESAQHYAQNPGALAQLTSQVHQEKPSLLGQLLGGNSSQLNNPIAKAALAGIAAMAAKRFLG